MVDPTGIEPAWHFWREKLATISQGPTQKNISKPRLKISLVQINYFEKLIRQDILNNAI
jgi:hypothetical protein